MPDPSEEELLARHIADFLRFLKERIRAMGGVVPPPLDKMSDADMESWALELARTQLPQLQEQMAAGKVEFPAEFLDTPLIREFFVQTAGASGAGTGGKSPDADGARIFYSKAMKKMQLENFKEARTMLKKAVELDPEFIDAWTELAACHERLSEVEKAARARLRAQELRDNGT